MATFFANAMPYIGLLWAIAFAVFIELIQRNNLGQATSLLKPMAGNVKDYQLMAKDA